MQTKTTDTHNEIRMEKGKLYIYIYLASKSNTCLTVFYGENLKPNYKSHSHVWLHPLVGQSFPCCSLFQHISVSLVMRVDFDHHAFYSWGPLVYHLSLRPVDSSKAHTTVKQLEIASVSCTVLSYAAQPQEYIVIYAMCFLSNIHNSVN